jgi:hypothetical protein
VIAPSQLYTHPRELPGSEAAMAAGLPAHGIVFPIVLIPVYAVPRAFLIHSFSLIGLLRKNSLPPKPTEALHYGVV